MFELIRANKRSSSAYELLEDLKKVNRKLNLQLYIEHWILLEQGLIHRVESTNSFISCCSCNAHKHFSHLLICDQCENVIESRDDSLVALLASNAEKHGFTISNHVIESHGVCQTCLSKEKKQH
ncbi:transcriptional repressor [Vibrio cholerae]|nr:transcriptional repressor [Vibrio cholerae]